jgi:predicted nucleotidyltransferase
MKKPYSLKREQKLYNVETARQKVIEFLFRYPEKEFSLSDLAKEAGVAKANIGRIIEEFRAAGFIEIEKLSKIWRIKANTRNPDFVNGKVLYNLSQIYNSNFVAFLDDYFGNPKAIVLFGSFRRGEDNSASDIDIAIETDETKRYQTMSLKEVVGKDLKKDVEKFEGDIGRKIQLHMFNRKSVDLNVFNNIANGIVLSGFLEVRP